MNKSPIENYDTKDPGDEMQLRIRYQHGYGVVLFCAALKGSIECKSLWFEQKEDIILEKENSNFVFYQVKTRDKTLGKWKMSDEALIKSIKRFCEFEKQHGETIERYVFVSNCPCRESNSETNDKDKCLSPINFFKDLKNIFIYSDLKGALKVRFDALVNSIGSTKENLLNTLRKVNVVVGPSLESFEIELSAIHLCSLSQLKGKGLTEINRIRDEFCHKIFYASSLYIEDPYKHIFCRIDDSNYDPRILSKKIDLEVFSEFVNTVPVDVFTYFKNSSELDIGSSTRNLSILRKKMDKAGLRSQYESLKRRSLSAEEHFLEEANKNPETFKATLDQVEGSVLGICSDAILDSTDNNKINGIEAFKAARRKLEFVAENHPGQVFSKNSECLIGVAGLLTGDCKLWWTEEFDLEGEL